MTKDLVGMDLIKLIKSMNFKMYFDNAIVHNDSVIVLEGVSLTHNNIKIGLTNTVMISVKELKFANRSLIESFLMEKEDHLNEQTTTST